MNIRPRLSFAAPKSHWNLDFPEFTALYTEDRSMFHSNIFLLRNARNAVFRVIRQSQVLMVTYLLLLRFLNVKIRDFSVVLYVSLCSFFAVTLIFISAVTFCQSLCSCCLRLMFVGCHCWECDFETLCRRGCSFIVFVVW